MEGRHAQNFARDMADDGLVVISLGRGRVADIIDPAEGAAPQN